MQERRKEEYLSEHSQCSDKDFSTNDEHNMFSDDGTIGSGEYTESEKYSQDPVVMVPPTDSRSEMAEISSLLSLAMPMANVNFLVNEGGGKDEAVAIEVRPRERQFRVCKTQNCIVWEWWEELKFTFTLYSTFPPLFVHLRRVGHLLPSGALSSCGCNPARSASTSSRWTVKSWSARSSTAARH